MYLNQYSMCKHKLFFVILYHLHKFFKKGITQYTMMLFGFHSWERSSKGCGQEVQKPELGPGPWSPKACVFLVHSCQPQPGSNLRLWWCQHVRCYLLGFFDDSEQLRCLLRWGVDNPGRLCPPRSLWLPVFLSSRVSQRQSLQYDHISQKTQFDLTSTARGTGAWGCGEHQSSLKEPDLKAPFSSPTWTWPQIFRTDSLWAYVPREGSLLQVPNTTRKWAVESQVASTPTGFQETLTVLRSPHFLLNVQSLGGESQGGSCSLLPPPPDLPWGISLCAQTKCS